MANTAITCTAIINGDASENFVIRTSSRAALVEFSKGNRQNAFSQPKMRELKILIKKLEADVSVGCVILFGGEGRSFSAGGDFNETSSFTGGDEVDTWLDDVTNLYTTIASISKPVIAAVDGFAVGLGLQIALCCDYRIGSETCQLIMPELRMGIACNFGGFMLEAVVGRVVMQKMLFTSDKWSAQTALKDGLLHEVVPSKELATQALKRAQIIGSWATSGVQETRPNINATFVSGLTAQVEQAKRSHRGAFSAGHAQVNMKQIITKNQQKTRSWILLTSTSIPSLTKALKETRDSGIQIYGQGAALTSNAYSWLEDNAEQRQFSEWATSIEVKGNLVRMRTGAMNDPPLYMIRNTTTRAWAVGTDVFSLNIARSQWGMPVGIGDPTVINRDETTSFLGVSQLPAHSYFELKKDGASWRFATEQLNDPVLAVLSPQITDFSEAGSIFVSSLQRAVSEITEGAKSVATLLSGGIDSGAVTTFAVLAGLDVTAYSAGSPWGNEHDEAKELADFLGIPHVCVDFSAEELLAAVPDSIRALGTAEQERVDIAVTINAMLRSGIIKEQHVLTGYGSDLLNLGLPPDSNTTEALLQEIIDGVDITRHSGEFNDFVARAWGKQLSHPYWHKDVIQTALNIHPACKVRDGREKAFFRAVMEAYVPKSTAWRKKIGIHLGGGLQGGLDATFGSRDGKIQAYSDTFKAITARLLADPFASIEDLSPQPSQTHIAMFTNGTSVKKGLMPSGAGHLFDKADATGDLAELSNIIQNETGRSGFVLVKNLPLNEDQFKFLVNSIGEPVIHNFKTGGSDLMKLNATREKGNVVLGRGPLPLHTDGIFVGHRPDIIILYASAFSDQPGSGETIVIDQLQALRDMPKELRDKLEKVKFEYQIQEAGHYSSLGEKWFSIPPIRTLDGKQYLNLALQFPPDTERSWNLRVAGVTEPESDKLLADLDKFLTQPRYKYQHRWDIGDLLVIDNSGTLHGRTAISDTGVRILFRGQVNRRAKVEV